MASAAQAWLAESHVGAIPPHLDNTLGKTAHHSVIAQFRDGGA
jgi:hypothetical protein